MMKKTLSTFLVLSVLVFGFGMVVFAEKEDLPKTGGDMICAIGVNCDDDQPVSCMALHCKKPHPPKPVRPEPVKPLPIVVDDTVVCMGLNCPKLPDEKEDTDSLPEWEIPECSIIDNPIVTPYLPPLCLGAYIDESGQLRNPCVERQVKENNEDEIKKHEKKVRDAANRESKLVKESIEKSRELEKTKKELAKAAEEAKKEALEARKATQKADKAVSKKQRELAQKEAKKQREEAKQAAEKEKQLEKKLKEINKVSDSARAAAKKAKSEREAAKKELDKVKSNK